MQKHLFEVKKLKKNFLLPQGEITVLKDLNFSIQEGEIVQSLAHLGQGKAPFFGY